MAKQANITCPKCDKDIVVASIENGRCPECEFNIQLYLDRKQAREVEEKERKAEEANNPAKKPELKRGLSGIGNL